MDDTSRSSTVTGIVVAVAGAAAGYAMFTNPPLRRTVWRFLKTVVTTTIPGIVLKEATAAWREAGRQAAA